VTAGRRNAARKPSAVGEMAMPSQDNSFSNDPTPFLVAIPNRCHPERSKGSTKWTLCGVEGSL